MQNPFNVFSILRTITLLLTAFGLLLSLSFLFRCSGPDSNTIPFGATSEKMGVFEKYNNQIYASVPSNGVYLIPEADAKTFYLPNDHY